jgi:ribosomal protein L22
MAEKKPKPVEKKEEQKKTEIKAAASEKKTPVKPLPVDKEKTRELEEKMKAEKTPETKTDDKESPDKKQAEKKTKKEEKPKVRKYEAIAKGENLHASKKQCMYICSFIKNKKIDTAISDLEQVTKMKKAVPFKGEIPHRKGNIMSGRYPVKASKLFITMLKGLKGNAIVNGMELEDTKIKTASASWARRPMRSGNRQAKRTNVLLVAKDLGSQQNISHEQNNKGKVGKKTDKVFLQEDKK